jgi:hypothetical protein
MLVLVAVPVASPSAAAPLMQLQGLDRLYFTQVGGAEAVTAPAAVAALLPRTLRAFRTTPPSREGDGGEITVEDFPLPLPNRPRELTLRQVIDSSHPRISELWLALYDEGRRSDVWHFQALPSLNEDKLLPNYRIESTRPGPDGGVILRLRGTMVRPQGAWWDTGKVVMLAAKDGALSFTHVRNAFGFRHEYDRGDGSEPSTDVRTEREVGGRFEQHDLDPAPEDVMKACGFLPDEGESGTWAEMETMAECITRAPGTTVSSRSPQEPSFPERGFTFKN